MNIVLSSIVTKTLISMRYFLFFRELIAFMAQSMKARVKNAPGAMIMTAAGSMPGISGVAEEPVRAQDLPDRRQDREGQAEADPHADPVQYRDEHAVLLGELLRPSQDDAVDHDERDENAERPVHLGLVGLEQEVDHGHEGRDDGDEDGDPQMAGHDLPDG